jgi:hypothetical protein
MQPTNLYQIRFGIERTRQGREIQGEEQDQLLHDLDRYISGVFPGYTRKFVRGGWRDPDEYKLIEEEAIVLELITTEEDWVLAAARFIKQLFEQSEVYIVRIPISLQVV